MPEEHQPSSTESNKNCEIQPKVNQKKSSILYVEKVNSNNPVKSNQTLQKKNVPNKQINYPDYNNEAGEFDPNFVTQEERTKFNNKELPPPELFREPWIPNNTSEEQFQENELR